ncbi:hypothetical protein JCM17844_06690 [Iodidimonas gelatinilytica]|uniref:Uncharacterized protein n=1 Tax=Iodidimonas gelatinilytica TaxID=1236966 RepID=A0A5A7MLZ3_9PROT|nr:hypothetical protein [Iodidimonas gelatinilytica]GEQ97032.1 hypothetical protein JCM17844_06690 [Iodidimonas gelatinilytica]GEQ99380.1 hypothetical protein JCM17845_00040 [Iodidimonas gelatinilytica]GER08197.1 hypothetical protein JCM17843_25070 [Kordiimonadales bacterium JCM 17843]
MTLPKTAEFHLSGDHVRRALDHLASNDTQLAEALSLWGYPQERRTDGAFPHCCALSLASSFR